MPAAAIAVSYASDWALTRYSTAISLAGTPAPSSARMRRAVAAASSGSLSNSVNVGAGPSGRCATSRGGSCRAAASTAPATPCVPCAPGAEEPPGVPRVPAVPTRATSRLASPTTCGVER